MLGVFGGSGFYSFLDDADDVTIDTPFGPPSAPIRVGTLAGRRVAFLPRHGPISRVTPTSRTASISGRTSGRCARWASPG